MKTIIDAQSFSMKGILSMIKLGKIEQARRDLSRRIELMPNDYKARLFLRRTYEKSESSAGELPGLKSCPCCGNSFPSFLSGGPSFRPNVCCPACESLERHRFLSLFLAEKHFISIETSNMLHVATESCLRDRFRMDFGKRYHTMNYLSEADVSGDLCFMPFKTQSMNIIMANHVLEHVKDDISAISEMYRVLRSGGTALLQIPQDRTLSVTQEAPESATPQDLLRLFGQDDHVRMYGNDFRDRLESVGFVVQEHVCKYIIPADRFETYGLCSDETVWEAVKP